MKLSRIWTLVLTALAFSWLLLPRSAAEAERRIDTGPMRVGVVTTLFRNAPQVMIDGLMQPFQVLMEEQTGIKFKAVASPDCLDLAGQLHEGRVGVGVFNGFEFAQARHHHPDLKPLVLAVTAHRNLKAYLVTRNDSRASSVADLRGQTLILLRYSRVHCLRFLDRLCAGTGHTAEQYFSRTAHSPNAEWTLDSVVKGITHVALVDDEALDLYRRRKPTWFARLKVVQESEPFPPAVVAYNPETLDAMTAGRLRDGLLKAHESRRGQEILTQCRVTAFEAIPDDFDRHLKKILEAYPPPRKMP